MPFAFSLSTIVIATLAAINQRSRELLRRSARARTGSARGVCCGLARKSGLPERLRNGLWPVFSPSPSLAPALRSRTAGLRARSRPRLVALTRPSPTPARRARSRPNRLSRRRDRRRRGTPGHTRPPPPTTHAAPLPSGGLRSPRGLRFPTWRRIRSITSGSVIHAIMRIRPPHRSHLSASTPHTRARSCAHVFRRAFTYPLSYASSGGASPAAWVSFSASLPFLPPRRIVEDAAP